MWYCGHQPASLYLPDEIQVVHINACFSLCARAQMTLSYEQLLENTPEISFTDSLLIDAQIKEIPALDSASVKKWFNAVLPAGSKNRLKNRTYATVGKITSQSNFDLFVLLEEKKRADSSRVQLHFTSSPQKKMANL